MKQRIVILGAGESGVGAAYLAKQKGFDVFVSDKGTIKPFYKEQLNNLEIEFEEGLHTESKILNADEIIKSPGIPEKAPIIAQAKAKGIKIISEIEFAGRYTKAVKICITGSNGKTTTTNLIYHILKNGGLNVAMVGNVGQSLAKSVADGDKDYYVIELSSFQLDDMHDFKADIAILLNITPDHLDRYNYDVYQYAASKMKVIQNQTEQDYFIYCDDDEITAECLGKYNIKSKKLPFSIQKTDSETAYLKENEMIIDYANSQFTMMIQDITIKGQHNVYNSMAASITSRVLDIRKEAIRESLTSFSGVEHRLESFLKVRNVEYINDSKATNVNSTWYALESMTKPIVWIAGGTDKGNDYISLNELARNKVKVLICLGVDNTKLLTHFAGIVPKIIEAKSMHEAVMKAYQLSEKGDAVLLSPACASFDLFKNYEDRGTQFKENVRNL